MRSRSLNYHFYRLIFIVSIFTLTTKLAADQFSTVSNTSHQAQMTVFCEKEKVVETGLAGYHGEEIFLKAESGSGDILKIYMNKKTKSYTVVRLGKNGKSCILDAGENIRPTSKSEKPT